MTVQAAKESLTLCKITRVFIPKDEVLEFVIQALEELEQYRAIGLTPEQIEAMQGHNIALINDLEGYQSLGTVEELKEAREKQIASKWTECPYADLIMCPSCNTEFSTIDNCTEQFEYCPKCGKRLE